MMPGMSKVEPYYQPVSLDAMSKSELLEEMFMVETRQKPIKDLRVTWEWSNEVIGCLEPNWTEIRNQRTLRILPISYAQKELAHAVQAKGISISSGTVIQFKVLHQYDPHDNEPGLRYYILLNKPCCSERATCVWEKTGHRTVIRHKKNAVGYLDAMPNGTTPVKLYKPCDTGISRAFRLRDKEGLRKQRLTFFEMQVHAVHQSPGINGRYHYEEPASLDE